MASNKMSISVVLYFIICMAVLERACGDKSYNVLDFGAVGNGIADDTQAFLRAWAALCADSGPNVNMLIPAKKTFLLRPLVFQGPCKARPVTVQVLGNIVGPNNIQGWGTVDYWLDFHSVNGLRISGNGRIGGQGAIWWNCKGCRMPPPALSFSACVDVHVVGVTLLDNPRNHISMKDCTWVSINNIFISAPASSPNTDGINIGTSYAVSIWDSTIATGDDCISVLTGTSNVNITRVNCGPGHGISVGSLGADNTPASVQDIHVYNCTFTGTSNAARIKTWQGGSGFARGITFQGIAVDNVQNPIIIDQYYCNGGLCGSREASAVAVSDVQFKGFRGTSSGKSAIQLSCSRTVGCTKIVVGDVQLKPANPKISLYSTCINAHGSNCPSCSPPLTCLI